MNFTKEFENCGAALNDPALSVVLEKFVEENAAPVKKAVTDSATAFLYFTALSFSESQGDTQSA